jgi:hypothetical protein
MFVGRWTSGIEVLRGYLIVVTRNLNSKGILPRGRLNKGMMMLVKRGGALRLPLPLTKKKKAEEGCISGEDYGKYGHFCGEC